MSTTKQQMLNTIRNALKDVPEDEHPENLSVERNYRQSGQASEKERTKLFAERVDEFKATVDIISEGQLAVAIEEACTRNQIKKLIVPPETPEEWLPAPVELFYDKDKPLSHEELNLCDGVITGCSVAIAETGTIALVGGPAQGRRVLTLLPDYHICVVRSSQIVETVSEAFAQIKPQTPITLISGPSATSDIELNRVEGVHGPRNLEVLIVQ
ncbi:MAG: lactate utilization protein C [Balneolales bacterium]